MEDKIIYKREVSYHDKDNVPQSSVLKITTRNNYVEFTMRNPDSQSDFNPKDGVQKALYHLWKTKHLTKICNLEDIEATKIFTQYCNDLCDTIETKEQEYLESLDVKTEEDINDDRIIALMKHLDITPEEAYYDIKEAKYGTGTYEYGNQEYQVLTDSEADHEEREYVEQMIEECYLAEYGRNMPNSPLLQYLDKSRWISDWCNNRGENLSGYDGSEYMENVNNTDYFIYRKN